MKELKEIETDEYVLEIVECDCGYHMGFDSSYLDQMAWVVAKCPCCNRIIDTEKILSPS